MSETGTSRAHATEVVSDELLEKRRFPRTRDYGPQALELVCLGEEDQEAVPATLWDFGEGGLGMESPRSFPPGEVLKISGELRGPDYSMLMEAKARVAYSRPLDAEFFRIGVAFIDVSYRRIAPPGE